MLFLQKTKKFLDQGGVPGYANWSAEERDHYRKERLYWLSSSVISCFALFSAMAGAYFAFGAYQEAKRQALIAQQSLNSSTRPWAVVEGVKAASPLVIQENNAIISVEGIVRNYAQNPIISASFSARLLQVNPGISYPLREAESFCNKFNEASSIFTLIVPPNSTANTLTTRVELKLDPHKYFLTPHEGRQFLSLTLIGCLSYAGLDGKSYQTVSYYRLHDSIDGVPFIESGNSVHAERLEFMIQGMFAKDKQY